ncbi:MAG TPA: hypothetical protein VHQ47_07660 [Phycisphaerae bacterium]|nr:hypothetical protein [Phycisphaerae bacterium]
MNDPLDDPLDDPLEDHLRGLTPAAPSPALESTLAAALDRRPLSRADCCLLATLSLAAAAACLAITLLTLDLAPPQAAATAALPANTDFRAFIDPTRALARLDSLSSPDTPSSSP